MKKLKILFVPSQTPDYLEDIVYHGLIQLLGRKNVIDYPFKQAYHYNATINLSKEYKKFPMLLFKDAKIPNYLKINFNDFDGVIIGSLRPDVIKEVYKVLKKVPKEKIIFLEGEDDPFIRMIYFKKLKAYFKREKLISSSRAHSYFVKYAIKRWARKIARNFYDLGYYNFYIPFHFLNMPIPFPYFRKIKPLPFAIIDIGYKPKNEKVYDFCFIGSMTSPFRKKVYNFLINYSKKKKLNAFISKGGLSWDQYMDTLSKSKIGINVHGGGSDCYRYWEIPYAGTMLLSELPLIEIPNNFVEGKSAAFFLNLKELEQKLNYYLKEERWKKIAKIGRKHLLKFHTSINRAKSVLKEFERVYKE